MANKITYKPTGTLLSSAIDNIAVQADGDFVDVTLSVADKTVLSERFYPYKGAVIIYDPSYLIEMEMRRTGRSYADVTLRVFTDSTDNNADSHTYHILYCDRFTVCSNVDMFLKENFLTTIANRRVANDSTVFLSLFLQENEPLLYTVLYRFMLPDGDTLSRSLVFNGDKKANAAGVQQITVQLPAIVADAAASANVKKSEITLLTVTVQCGQRSVTCFVDYALNDSNCFYFRNCFNVRDCACLPILTTAKTDVNRDTAVINGMNTFYNQSQSKIYEVTTGPLTSDEARWIDQLFTSYEVTRYLPNDCDDTEPFIAVQVLLSDISCEMSDGDDKPNTAKFSWQFADKRCVVHLTASSGVFNDKFQLPFS